jgi:hypothetical protein
MSAKLGILKKIIKKVSESGDKEASKQLDIMEGLSTKADLPSFKTTGVFPFKDVPKSQVSAFLERRKALGKKETILDDVGEKVQEKSKGGYIKKQYRMHNGKF